MAQALNAAHNLLSFPAVLSAPDTDVTEEGYNCPMGSR